MRRLVIAEKPSAASAIAEALGGGFQRREGYWERSDLVITWALGHLVRYADPEAYGEEYGRPWRLDVLPILPERFKLVPDEDGKEQLKVILQLLRTPGFTSVVNACDAGREGEHIFRLIYAIAGCRLPVERLWTASLTPEGIREAWERMQPGSAYDALAAAARARAEADWLVGMNLTRAFSVHHGTLLSAGRVQTPVLALVVRREQEIAEFKPRDYWKLFVELQNPAGAYRGKWVKDDTDRFDVLAEARRIQELVAGQTGRVVKVERKQRREPPPPLFDLTALQREMNRRYGFTAQKTLALAQRLYEEHKVITYPRTDSRFLTRDIEPKLPDLVASLGDRYPDEVRFLMTRRVKAAHVINDRKVTDHHAIIPTGRAAVDLTPDEEKVYDAICRRFLAVFYPPHVADITVIVTEVAGETFESRGSVVVDPGWRALYPKEAQGGDRSVGRLDGKPGAGDEPEDGERADESADPPEDEELPPVEEGSVSQVTDTEIAARQTKPPPRYTEASLLAAMERAGKFVESQDLREALKSRGLGTPATRAAILERLKEVGYIRLQGRHLVPTEKGIHFIRAIPIPLLRSPEMTAEWEMALTRIEEGEGSYQDFIQGIRTFVSEAVKTIAASARSEALHADAAGGGAEPLGTCPVCGSGSVRQRSGKSGTFFGCDRYPECRFVLPGERLGKRLTPALVKELLSARRTRLIQGFRSPKGVTFAAHLVLTDDNRLEFQFPERKGGTAAPARSQAGSLPAASGEEAGGAPASPAGGETVGACPLCGKPVVVKAGQSGRFYGCSGYPGCRFTIGGTILGRTMAPAEVRALLESGATPLLEGFRGSRGAFSAHLVLEGGKVQFRFPDRCS